MSRNPEQASAHRRPAQNVRRQAVHSGPSVSDGPLRFADKLLDGGRFCATYKCATPVALIDVCAEPVGPDGAPNRTGGGPGRGTARPRAVLAQGRAPHGGAPSYRYLRHSAQAGDLKRPGLRDALARSLSWGSLGPTMRYGKVGLCSAAPTCLVSAATT